LVIKLLRYVNLSFFYSPSEVEKKTALVIQALHRRAWYAL